ncbi:NAD(P)-dependent oxidoreductase [Paenibacillus lentus]|uniref:NAD-dependent epimerase/dehydratase family protein n=1 Tax=Paenibacillus lentus TaxID=1338368 RepID=A0A3Q8S6M9_9BACL|nr:NAD(P)H-binding protein [Paenibacillus lentus]AZK48441.1 NAD-dependent epimerase/dehydratase family protein [Paenibacillus lentus]
MNNNEIVAIIGGTGKVGRYVAAAALRQGYRVRMLVRNPDRLVNQDNRIEVIKGHADNISDLRQLLQDCHIVINAFGQPAGDTPLYSFVTSLVLEVMNELEISRYIGVTGGSLTLEGDRKSLQNKLGAWLFKVFFPNMIKDKQKEAAILEQYCNIEWTLIRLPFVVESEERGNVKVNLTDMPGIKISNQDIASFIIDEVLDRQYIHKTPFIAT